MNDQFPSTLQLDLDYDDPPGTPDLAARARAQGRRLRRTRRVGALAVATLIASGGVAAVADPPWSPGRGGAGVQAAAQPPLPPTSPSPSASLPDLERLSVSRGRGPTIDRFTSQGFQPGRPALADNRGFYPPLGPRHTVATDADGDRTVLFVSKNAFLCVSAVQPGGGGGDACHPLVGLPAQGFWGGFTLDDTSPGDPPIGAPVMVAGLVRGPVDRVLIHTPRGDVEATLAPTSDPELGTLYWAVTAVPMGSKQTWQIDRIAYRGDTAVFACQGARCLKG